ncbi:hypothetical protein ACHQM5_016799 [Ranunculus cassubicifolius]
MNSDGSLRADGAGFGGVVRDHGGHVNIAFSGGRKYTNILMLELEGILNGVKIMRQVQYWRIWIESASQRAVNALLGTEMGPWYSLNMTAEILEELQGFEHYRIEHCRRECNTVADFLAKVIVDSNVI